MHRATLFVMALLLSSCGKPAGPANSAAEQMAADPVVKQVEPPQPTAPRSVTSPPALSKAAQVENEPEPREAEFKNRLTVFLDEAESLARFCERSTDRSQFVKKRNAVLEAFSRLPAVSARHDLIVDLCGAMVDHFNVAAANLDLVYRLSALAGDIPEARAEECVQEYRKAAVLVKSQGEEIRKAIAAGREPVDLFTKEAERVAAAKAAAKTKQDEKAKEETDAQAPAKGDKTSKEKR